MSADQKLLLGKSRQGGVYQDTWIIPGGGIDEDETHEQALAREIMEETGLGVSEAKIQKMEINLNGQSEKTLKDTGETVLVDMVFYNYLITFPKNSDTYKTSGLDDFEQATWVPVSELRNYKVSPPTEASLIFLGYLE